MQRSEALPSLRETVHIRSREGFHLHLVGQSFLSERVLPSQAPSAKIHKKIHSERNSIDKEAKKCETPSQHTLSLRKIDLQGILKEYFVNRACRLLACALGFHSSESTRAWQQHDRAKEHLPLYLPSVMESKNCTGPSLIALAAYDSLAF